MSSYANCYGVEVKIACGIPNVPTIFEREKVPDIAIYKNNISCLQFEVESNNDKEATIYKLVYGLMDQRRIQDLKRGGSF